MDKVIGHRGACGYAPENTMASFEVARAMGCRSVEFDVMLSADGEAFIFHDENLKRTTNGVGQFGQVTSNYIRKLDAGRWFSSKFRGEAVPSLDETLHWLAHANMQANIEIKPYPGMTNETALATLMSINRHWPQEKPLPLVSSFDVDALRTCRSYSPELPLGLLIHVWDKDWLRTAEELQCVSVHLNKRVITEKRVQEIKSHGYKVYAYTVNRKFTARRFFKWGVDAVFSDYPNRIGDV